MIIYRYISRELLKSVLTASVMLLAIFLCVEFAHFLKNAAGGKFGLSLVTQMLLLQVPFLLTIILPLGFFLGCQLALGQLYIHQEMVIIQASGVSPGRMMLLILRLAAVVALFVGAMTLWLQPKMLIAQRQLLVRSAQTSVIDQITPQQFQQVKNGRWVLYADHVNRHPRALADIFVGVKHHFTDTAKPQDIIVAKSVQQGHSTLLPGSFLLFNDGTRYHGTPGQRDYEVIHFKQYGIRVNQSDQLSRSDRMEQLPTLQLWQHRYQRAGMAELQWRLGLALMSMVLVPYILPLSRTNPRQGRFIRLLPALLVFAGYASLLFSARIVLMNPSMPLWLGSWWVHLLVLLGALPFYKTKR